MGREPNLGASRARGLPTPAFCPGPKRQSRYTPRYGRRTTRARRRRPVTACARLDPRRGAPEFHHAFLRDTETAGHAAVRTQSRARGGLRVYGSLASSPQAWSGAPCGWRTSSSCRIRHVGESTSRVVILDDYILTDDWRFGPHPSFGIFPKRGRKRRLSHARQRHPRSRCPAHQTHPLAFTGTPAHPPIVGVMDDGWQVMLRSTQDIVERLVRGPAGELGYDPRNLRALLFVRGTCLQQVRPWARSRSALYMPRRHSRLTRPRPRDPPSRVRCEISPRCGSGRLTPGPASHLPFSYARCLPLQRGERNRVVARLRRLG